MNNLLKLQVSNIFVVCFLYFVISRYQLVALFSNSIFCGAVKHNDVLNINVQQVAMFPLYTHSIIIIHKTKSFNTFIILRQQSHQTHIYSAKN